MLIRLETDSRAAAHNDDRAMTSAVKEKGSENSDPVPFWGDGLDGEAGRE
jgi:hypothetical protein